MTTLIRNGIVLPLTQDTRRVFDPGSVLVDGNTIVAVGTVAEIDADPRVAGAEIVDVTDHAVIPGLHNCHLHSGLLRGTAESMSLWDWLKAYVDPAHKALTPEIARVASLQCYAESLLSGTTSVMDMWRFMEGSAHVAAELGIRATLVPYLADEDGFDYFESIESNRRLLESYRTAADGRVRTWVGLEHLMYCTKECFAQAVELMDEFDTGLHTHSSETIWEVEESLKRWGRRPIEVFYDRGVLGPRTVIAHAVWLSDREIELLAWTGTSVAHCPTSNMKLASGAARVGDLRRAGVSVGIGSDGEKENNNLDLVEEMKVASAAAKGHHARPHRRRSVGHPPPSHPRRRGRARSRRHYRLARSRQARRRRDRLARRPAHNADHARRPVQRRRAPRVLRVGPRCARRVDRRAARRGRRRAENIRRGARPGRRPSRGRRALRTARQTARLDVSGENAAASGR